MLQNDNKIIECLLCFLFCFGLFVCFVLFYFVLFCFVSFCVVLFDGLFVFFSFRGTIHIYHVSVTIFYRCMLKQMYHAIGMMDYTVVILDMKA